MGLDGAELEATATPRPVQLEKTICRRPSKLYVTLLACIAFFLRFTALAAFSPYLFLWLEDNGYSNRTRSYLGVLFSCTKMIAPMLWGSVADWGRCHRLLFIVLSIANGLAVFALTFYPGLLLWQAGVTPVLPQL